MRKTLILLNVIFYVFNSSCDRFDTKLEVINNSEDSICYGIQYSNIVDYRSHVLAPNESTNPPILTSWENKITRDCQDSTIRVFFLEKRVMDKLGWDSVYRGHIYSKKYELKVKDLEKLNWKIHYKTLNIHE